MFSICSSTYQETDELNVFVRSLIYNASDPSMLEIIITNDEGYDPTTCLLDELQEEFSQVKSLTITKEERIAHIQDCIDLYVRDKIFPDEDVSIMVKTLDRYKNGEIDRLWFTSAEGYNMSARAASGDILGILPSDYVCFFDATSVYNKCKEALSKNGKLACQFGWIRLSTLSDSSLYTKLVDVITQRDAAGTKESLLTMLNSALKENLSTTTTSQHGARVVDVGLFNEVGGFDERWFLRGMHEEFFNAAIDSKLNVDISRCPCQNRLGLNNLFVGEQRVLHDVSKDNVYLLPDLYSSHKHDEFVDKYLYPYLGIFGR